MQMKRRAGAKRRIDYDKLVKLRECGKSFKEIASILGISPSGGRYAAQIAKSERQHSQWDAQEEDYLLSRYGTMSDTSIAHNLNRELSEVRAKAKEMRLGSKLDNVDGVTLSSIATALWGNSSAQYQRKLLDMGVPYTVVSYGNEQTYHIVNLDDFFKWAKKHQDELNFCKFEKWIFGKEPAWVDIKRKKDWAEYREKRWEAYT